MASKRLYFEQKFPIFKLKIGFVLKFFHFSNFFENSRILSIWSTSLPSFSEIKETFFSRSVGRSVAHSSLTLQVSRVYLPTTRTGAVGLGRFRLVHSRWRTAGEKLFFSYFFFLYIFSFFFLFCLFLLFLLGLNAARARLGGFKIKIRLKCYKGIPS